MAVYPRSDTDRTVAPADLLAVTTAIFAACGMSPADAALLAETLVHSDRRGVHSHGVIRIPDYVKKLTADGVDPRGVPAIVSRRAGAMPESLPAKKARARQILARLARAYPDARTELEFRTPLDLLVATILSAQCTDQRVNAVTAALFPRYRTAADWAGIPLPTLERLIHSTGFFRAKARAISGMYLS